MARAVTPQSAFGKFLGTLNGAASVVLGSCVFVCIAWIIAEKVGYPFAKWERESDPE